MVIPASVLESAENSMVANIRLNRVGAKSHPCFTPLDTGKGSDTAVFHYASHHAIMERSDDADKLWWTAKLGQNGPQALTTDGIKRLRQVHKQDVEVLVLFTALLLQLAKSEDHVDCSPIAPEATLGRSS